MSAPRSAFDEYTLKARVFPAVLIAAPAATLLVFAGKQDFVWGISVVTFLAITSLSAQLLLHQGRLTEGRLVAKWGAMPTTLALKSTATGSKPLLARRRADVERVSGMALPSPRRERDHESDALQEYDHAVRLCIDRIRSGERGSRLLFIENIAYGFRRNLRAGRAVGLLVACASLAASTALVVSLGAAFPALAAMIVNVVALVVWIFGVTDRWVRDQADKYATSFFRALDGVEPATARP